MHGTLNAQIFLQRPKTVLKKTGKASHVLSTLRTEGVLTNGIEKAYNEAKKSDTKVVMLIPARTDTKYWHNYVMKASEIHFVKGRLKFGDSDNSAPFPSAVVVFDGGGELWRVEGINR